MDAENEEDKGDVGDNVLSMMLREGAISIFIYPWCSGRGQFLLCFFHDAQGGGNFYFYFMHDAQVGGNFSFVSSMMLREGSIFILFYP